MKVVRVVAMSIFTSIAILVSCISPVFAYEYPDGSPYMTVHDSYLGDITLHFTYNPSYFYLSLKDDLQPVAIGSSGISAYFEYQGTEYTMTFSPYRFGSYRLSGTGQITRYLNVTEIKDTNIPFVTNESFVSTLNNSSITTYCMIGGFIILCLLLFKR